MLARAAAPQAAAVSVRVVRWNVICEGAETQSGLRASWHITCLVEVAMKGAGVGRGGGGTSENWEA